MVLCAGKSFSKTDEREDETKAAMSRHRPVRQVAGEAAAEDVHRWGQHLAKRAKAEWTRGQGVGDKRRVVSKE